MSFYGRCCIAVVPLSLLVVSCWLSLLAVYLTDLWFAGSDLRFVSPGKEGVLESAYPPPIGCCVSSVTPSVLSNRVVPLNKI